MRKTLIPLLLVFIFSCKQKTPAELLQGSWKFDKTPEDVDARMIITKNTMLYKNKIYQDSASYTLSPDGKTITTSERNGNVDELEIIKLTADELVLTPRDKHDTLRLSR